MAPAIESTHATAGLQCEKVHTLAGFVVGDFEFAGCTSADTISFFTLSAHNVAYGK